MRTYKYGNRDSWLTDKGQTYRTLKQAWMRNYYAAPRFLYVYEDEDLIAVLELTNKLNQLNQEHISFYIQAAKELLKEHGIKE